MRCPKCGYISFDYLDECLKCKKNIKAATTKLQGTVYKVAAPVFLNIQSEEEYAGPSGEPVDLFGDELTAEADEYVDEDLEILVDSQDENQEEAGADLSLGENEDPDLKVDAEAEEEEGIEIDLSQFEDAAEPELAVESADSTVDLDDSLEIEMPEELADISDLAPPAAKSAEKVEQPEPELSLDDLDFDLDVEGITGSKSSLDSEKPLSLDEIDFADTLSGSDSAETRKGASLSMDDDLDFELDLGGLSIHKND